MGCRRVLVCWGGGGWGVALLECLPKEVEPRAIPPLGLLHADPVRWHPGSSYAAMGGAHQSDCNPTIDVSARLQVGLIPLGGQATGYPFQGSRRLHPQQTVQRGDKGGEGKYQTFLTSIGGKWFPNQINNPKTSNKKTNID